MRAPITVIIPVYEAFEDAFHCVESVLRHRRDESVLIIDDASPSGNFRDYLRQRGIESELLHIERLGDNVGFVKACNIGMTLAGRDDVILLNSDTIVSKRWCGKLREAAYSSREVGTVTPFTNNGTICSLPEFLSENELPTGFSVEEMNELVEQQSSRSYPVLPTCVGFCVYIKREVLDTVGLFRENYFSKGYGEENDLSCRAQKSGYVDILDDQTFVFHRGGRSFSTEKERLQAENSKVLARLHPGYFPRVTRFCRQNPLESYQRPIQQRLIEKALQKGSRRILHLLHNGPFRPIHHPLGGTERIVQDMICGLPELFHFSLVSGRGSFLFSAHFGSSSITFPCKRDSALLQQLLKPGVFDVVHLHHTRGFPLDMLSTLLSSHPQVVTSIHDFVTVCPRFHLVTPSNKPCSLHECQTSCGYQADFIDRYRSSHLKVLSSSSVVCFSHSSQELLSKGMNHSIQAKLIEHGVSVDRPNPLETETPQQSKELRVALLGTLSIHKGKELVDALSRRNSLPSGFPLRMKLFGETVGSSSSLEQSGRYHGIEQLRELLSQFHPHLFLFPSICPETYGLVVDEALLFGVPVVVGPNGAPRERVERHGAGWILPSLSEESILGLFESIVQDDEGYLQCRHRAREVSFSSFSEQIKEYEYLYSSSSRKTADGEILSVLRQEQYLLKPGLGSRLREKFSQALDLVFMLLARTGLRAPIEGLVRKIVPSRTLEKIRSFR